MLTQMAFKQIATNAFEFIQPIIRSKKKLEQHYEEYAGIVKLYDDSQTENKTLKKTLSRVSPNNVRPLDTKINPEKDTEKDEVENENADLSDHQ